MKLDLLSNGTFIAVTANATTYMRLQPDSGLGKQLNAAFWYKHSDDHNWEVLNEADWHTMEKALQETIEAEVAANEQQQIPVGEKLQ